MDVEIDNKLYSYILNIGRNKETGRYGLYDILNSTENAIKKIKENTPSVSIASPIPFTSTINENEENIKKNDNIKFSLQLNDDYIQQQTKEYNKITI